MSETVFLQFLDLAVGLVLICAFVVLWRRSLVAIVHTLAVQGFALAGVALLLGVHDHDLGAVAVAGLVLALKGVVLPRLLLSVVGSSRDAREVEPLVNIPASLLAAALLTMIAYATTQVVVDAAPSAETRAIPVGVGVVLIGFFVLSTRRKALTQVVGFLLVDNGITLVAFLATAGVPLVVELGASLDLLLAVLVLQVLTVRMRSKFGALDLDQLQELHD